jgi:hypothetical protein
MADFGIGESSRFFYRHTKYFAWCFGAFLHLLSLFDSILLIWPSYFLSLFFEDVIGIRIAQSRTFNISLTAVELAAALNEVDYGTELEIPFLTV